MGPHASSWHRTVLTDLLYFFFILIVGTIPDVPVSPTFATSTQPRSLPAGHLHSVSVICGLRVHVLCYKQLFHSTHLTWAKGFNKMQGRGNSLLYD